MIAGNDRSWHFAPLVVRPLSARCDGGTESAPRAQPARPSVTTLPVGLRPSAAASTWGQGRPSGLP